MIKRKTPRFQLLCKALLRWYISMGAGSPLQRGLPAGERSADSRGSAPSGASGRGCGQVHPVAPSDTDVKQRRASQRPRHFAALGLKVS